jgi:hypothetical protein
MKIAAVTACLCLIGPSIFVTAFCTQTRPSDTPRQRPVDPESRTTATDRGNLGQPASGVRFAEVTPSGGIHFQHFDPVTDKQFISETIGSGAGWIDIDGDGHLDLVLINSAPMPNGKPPERQPINHVYRNRRDGSFEDVTGNAWGCPPGFGQGCAVGDSDNDGFDDLYVSYYLGANRLFHNNGDGTFRDLSAWSGTDCPLWSTSCAWGDLDGDGDLDLYVCNYLDMPLDKYPYCGDPRRKIRTVCSPVKFAAQPDTVYCNDGEGRFTDATEAWGFRVEPGRALGVVIADLDGDRLSDVYVANDRSPNLLFHNLGSGRFQEQGLLTGSALSADGMAQAGMGVDAGDVDGDGQLDLFVTNFFHEPNSLFRNDGSLAFREISARSGLGRPSFLRLGFGCGLFDADNDGHLDVFVANGHVDRNPEIHGFAEPYRQPAQLFLGNGHARFAECDARTAGEYFEQRHVGRAAAFADYDNDGRMDIAVNHNGESAALLRNESTGGHWLRVVLAGTATNRGGVGTRVTATAGGRRLVRELVGGRSYLSAHDPRLLIGLGTGKVVERLEIRWPNGKINTLADLPADQTIGVRE